MRVVAIRADVIEQDRSQVDIDRDRALVLRYQSGDEGAFDELYRRYYPRLHLYCQRRVGDRHAAEELAQEAFLRALRAMPRFAGERRFYPWMTVIAQRLCIDHHRRTARVEPAPEVDTGTVEADHDALFAAVDAAHLDAAMGRVAPRHRDVLTLREREGWSYNQIAAHLDVPVTTVEALLHRARKALRREFLAVSSGSRLAALPLLGPAVSALARWRARWSGASGNGTISQAAPVAAAGLAALGLALVPFAGGGNADAAPTAPPTVTTVAAPGTPTTVAGAPVVVVATDPAPAVPVPVAVGVAAPAPELAAAAPAPDIDLGPVAAVYTTPEGAARAGEQAREMPLRLDIDPNTVIGLDPLTVLQDLFTQGGK